MYPFHESEVGHSSGCFGSHNKFRGVFSPTHPCNPNYELTHVTTLSSSNLYIIRAAYA